MMLEKTEFQDETMREWEALVSTEDVLKNAVADPRRLNLRELERYQNDLNRYRSGLARFLLKHNGLPSSCREAVTIGST